MCPVGLALRIRKFPPQARNCVPKKLAPRIQNLSLLRKEKRPWFPLEKPLYNVKDPRPTQPTHAECGWVGVLTLQKGFSLKACAPATVG